MEFLKTIAEWRTPALDQVFLWLTKLGEEAITIAAVCIIYWCISKKLAYGVGFTYFFSGLAVNTTKIACRIDRPWVVDPGFAVVEAAKAKATGYSFPSGHTQGATSLYGTLGLTVRKGWLRRLLLLLCVPIVGLSRMYLGVHTPEDVVVGFGIAAILAIIFAIVYHTDGFGSRFFSVTAIILTLCSAGAMAYCLMLTRAGTIGTEYAADTAKMAGASVGFALGCVLENRLVRFETRTKHGWQQAVKLVVGVAVALGLRAGLKALFAAVAPGVIALDALRYFLTVLWAIYIWPAIFWPGFKPDEAQEARGGDQHEITEPGPLLDKKGRLCEAGFARSLVRDYDRKAIKAAKHRIKEWDYYYVGNEHFGVALTIDDNSYMGLASISLLNFDEKRETTKSLMKLLTNGKVGLPATSGEGVASISGKGYSLKFKNDGECRTLSFRMDDFRDGMPIEGEITLACPPDDSMVIVTPFAEDDKAFYYNQKINCMPASGMVICGDDTYRFDPGESFGVLDWGRGVWTYRNTWYWGSASGLHDGERFGFNIGYGFGNTNAASENMLFYKGVGHKLSRVTFNIPQKDGKDDFCSPWTFTSDDGRFEMDFEPVINRRMKTDLGIICSDQNQVFGKYSGKAVLDDGTVLEIKDLPGFAEKVFNKW